MVRLFPDDKRDIHLTLNGFPLDGIDDNGSEWVTSYQGVTGLFDGVGTTVATSTKVFSDGWFTNTAVRTGRTIAIQGWIIGNCTENCVRSFDMLKRALLPNDQKLEITLGSIRRELTVKQASSAPLVKWAGLNILQYSLGLISKSSYLFGTNGVTGKTGLPQSSGGMTFPYHFENFQTTQTDSTWLFSETVVAGSVNITSNGTAPSPVTIRIDGDVKNPTITHLQTGKVIKANGEIGTGHYIIFDGTTKQILMDGADPVQGQIARRQWSEAQPGQNTWQFAADEYSESALLTVTFREAFV